jgi:transposase-like protein
MARPRAIGPELAAIVLEDVGLGDRISAVARRYGISPTTVRRLVRLHGIPPRPPGRPTLWSSWPEAQREALLRDYASGVPLIQMAKTYDLSPATISRLVQEAIEDGNQEASDARIARLHYEDGLTIARLARLFRRSTARIKAILDAHRPADSAPRGKPVAEPTPRLSDQDALALADAYRRGRTVSDLCKQFGLPVGTFYRTIYRAERLMGLPRGTIMAERCMRPFTCQHPLSTHATLYAELANALAKGTTSLTQLSYQYRAPRRVVRERLLGRKS